MPLTPEREAAVWSHLWNRGRFGRVVGVGGVLLTYVAVAGPPGAPAVVIAPGRAESILKHAELVYDLAGRGYAVYVLDHRGQGLSERILGQSLGPEHPTYHKGYVQRFDHYVEDLRRFVSRVVVPRGHSAIFGFGHSMGGAIFTRWIQTAPTPIRALVLTSPLYKLHLSVTDAFLLRFLVTSGLGKGYVPGRGPLVLDEEPFESNRLMSDRARYAFVRRGLEAFPRAHLGGPTLRWAHQAILAAAAIRRDAHLLDVPTLLFHAPDDQVIDPAGHLEVAAAAPNLKLVALPSSLHEPYLEVDPIRDVVLHRTFGWWRRYGGL